jgi:hypothetical protein
LPKHQPHDCTIDIQERAQLPFETIYHLSQDKLVALHEYINKKIEKGFIRHFKSPIATFIFFLQKKDGSL